MNILGFLNFFANILLIPLCRHSNGSHEDGDDHQDGDAGSLSRSASENCVVEVVEVVAEKDAQKNESLINDNQNDKNNNGYYFNCCWTAN